MRCIVGVLIVVCCVSCIVFVMDDTLLNRSSAIFGLGTVLAKNPRDCDGEDAGKGAHTRATAKPTNPSTTATAPTPLTAPAPGLGLVPSTTAFNPSFTMPPVRTPRCRVKNGMRRG